MEIYIPRVKPFLKFVNISFTPGKRCTISSTYQAQLPIGFMILLPNTVTSYSEKEKSAWYQDLNGEIDFMNKNNLSIFIKGIKKPEPFLIPA
jgi:hypothetical protein